MACIYEIIVQLLSKAKVDSDGGVIICMCSISRNFRGVCGIFAICRYSKLVLALVFIILVT